MIPRSRWCPHHRRIHVPLGGGFAGLLALLLTVSSANAQLCCLTDTDCFKVGFGSELVRVTAGTEPEFPSYDVARSGWAVPGGTGTIKVSLENRVVVGSVRTFLQQGSNVPGVGLPIAVETTERTQGFQVDWTIEGDQLQVHLFSTSGAVIEPGRGPIYHVVYQVSSDFEWEYFYDIPDVIKMFGAGFVNPDGSSDGWGRTSVVLDPLGQAIPWCGNLNPVVPQGGGIIVINPAAVFQIPPMVTGLAPYLATNVDVNTNVKVYFSKAVRPETVNGSTVTLSHASVTVPATLTLSGLTAMLNPDAPLESGTAYTVRVTDDVLDLDGIPVSNYGPVGGFTTSAITGVQEPAPEAPSVTASPNPFGAETSIAYGLPTAGHASVRIYSASGRLVRTLVDSDEPAGVRFARWDGRDSEGKQVGSGIYFLRFATSGVTKMQRLMLLR